ncbi:hypothetical protein AB9M75_04180 [Lactobacillus sp. AN1001]
MNVIETLAEKSWDLGLNATCEGEFNNLSELKEILDGVYPWEVDDQDELVDQLLDDGYLAIESEYVYEIQIVNENKVYTIYRDIEIMEMFDKIIYDKIKNNYLLGFSNSGWLHIDAAIDLASGMIGYFNAQENIFTPVKNISEDDIEMLRNVIEEYEFTVDWEAEVKRVEK